MQAGRQAEGGSVSIRKKRENKTYSSTGRACKTVNTRARTQMSKAKADEREQGSKQKKERNRERNGEKGQSERQVLLLWAYRGEGVQGRPYTLSTYGTGTVPIMTMLAIPSCQSLGKNPPPLPSPTGVNDPCRSCSRGACRSASPFFLSAPCHFRL